MALRTARYACFEHDSLSAMIDVCPPENSDGLFEVDADAWAVAKLYTTHDELEGVQFRNQLEIQDQDNVELVVRELADQFYEQFGVPGDRSSSLQKYSSLASGMVLIGPSTNSEPLVLGVESCGFTRKHPLSKLTLLGHFP